MKNQKTEMLSKKDSETNKIQNPLIYDPKHSFYKYRLSEFNKISSNDSELHKIEKYYQYFIALMDVDAESENITHKIVVLNKVSILYGNLMKECKKVYERGLDDKNDGWKQKYKPTNFKALIYRPVDLKTKSLPDEDSPDTEQSTQLKQLNLNEITKPLWINVSRKILTHQ